MEGSSASSIFTFLFFFFPRLLELFINGKIFIEVSLSNIFSGKKKEAFFKLEIVICILVGLQSVCNGERISSLFYNIDYIENKCVLQPDVTY